MVLGCHLLRVVMKIYGVKLRLLILIVSRLSGLSPFMGDNDAETFANITRADYDFEDEAFNTVSQSARDFIGTLLLKRKE